MSNAQKIPLSTSLNKLANRKINNAYQALGKALPCSVVSVDGSIVTVKFEVQSGFTLPQVTVPHFGPQYVRYPTQQGDEGVVFPADARLGGVSGLGGGVADLSQPGNLTALVFFPIANTAWAHVDPNALVMYGPNGCVLRDEASDTTLTLTPSGVVIVCQTTFQVIVGTSQILANASEVQLQSGAMSVTVTPAGTIVSGPLGVSGVTAGGTVSMVNGTQSITMSGSEISLNGTVKINGHTFDTHQHSGVQPGGGNSGGVV